MMSTLFPLEPVGPDGFQYLPGFVSEMHEEELLQIIAGIDLHAMKFQGFEAKRRVASFGLDWSFEQRRLSKGTPIPSRFFPLMQQVADYLQRPVGDFAELLVTEYAPGTVINWHRDAPPFGLIAGISLLSDCRFRLRPYDKKLQNRKALRVLNVARRSLYIMDGPARSEWEHSIAPVAHTRFSITLRTLGQQLLTSLLK
jgi:alkylated DNA repair dioxygenase AlkB